MPARLRGAAFCTPGRRGLRDGVCHVWARGLRGGAARLAWINTAGVVCSRQNGSEERGLREVLSAQPRRGGGEGEAEHTLPRTPRSSPQGGRSAGTPPPPHGSPVGPGAPAPTAEPGLAAAWQGLPCGATRPPPCSPSSTPPRPESRARRPRWDGHCGGPGLPGGLLVAGQLSGREGGVRTRKRSAGAAGEGRGRSAEAPAGSGLAEKVQTRWR